MDSRGELSVSLISLLISSTWGAPMFFGTEMRTVPDFLKGKARTLCAADGSWYSCESEYCRHVRPCPSEPGLLACSCTKPTLAVAGTPYSGSMAVDANGFVRVERTWMAGDTVVLVLPAEIRATKRLTFADGVENKKYQEKEPWVGQNTTSNLPFCVIERGPLTYALPMEQEPNGPHNFAVDCDPGTMSFSRRAMPKNRAWDWPLDAPLAITVKAKPFNWPDVWRLPDNPVSQNETTGPLQTLKLIPYGNIKVLKISMLD